MPHPDWVWVLPRAREARLFFGDFGPDRIGAGSIGPDWTGFRLDWIGLDWIGFDQNGLGSDRSRLDWVPRTQPLGDRTATLLSTAAGSRRPAQRRSQEAPGPENSAAGRGCEKPARQQYGIIRILPVKLRLPHCGQKRRQYNSTGKTHVIMHTSQSALFTHPMKHVCLERPERVRPVKHI